MNDLEGAIADEIRSDGPISVARFMDLALYHPEFGYYTTGPARIGWRGHFLTSPEVDSSFGELWARGFEDVWNACERPERFDVVEIGPGEAGFSAAVLDVVDGDFARALRYRLVEPSDALRARQAAKLQGLPATWTPSLEAVAPFDAGCVFANEVLDNLPVRVVQEDNGRVHEVMVALDNDALSTTSVPADPDLVAWLERCGLRLPPGGRAEVGMATDRLIAAAAGRIGRGALILCDYGMSAAEASLRTAGTLTCYSKSGADDRFLDAPGTKDITSHVNWSAVERELKEGGLTSTGVVVQRTVLKRLGIDAMHDDLRSRGKRGGIETVRALSRRQALGVLTDPGGLGGMEVVAGLKQIETPAFLQDAASGSVDQLSRPST